MAEYQIQRVTNVSEWTNSRGKQQKTFYCELMNGQEVYINQMATTPDLNDGDYIIGDITTKTNEQGTPKFEKEQGTKVRRREGTTDGFQPAVAPTQPAPAQPVQTQNPQPTTAPTSTPAQPQAPAPQPAPAPKPGPAESDKMSKADWDARDERISRAGAQGRAIKYIESQNRTVQIGSDLKRIIDWFHADLRNVPARKGVPDDAVPPKQADPVPIPSQEPATAQSVAPGPGPEQPVSPEVVDPTLDDIPF